MISAVCFAGTNEPISVKLEADAEERTGGAGNIEEREFSASIPVLR
jgi:hypothetical protein